MEFNTNRLIALLKKDLREFILPTLSVITIVIAVILGFSIFGQVLDNDRYIDLYPQYIATIFISFAVIGSISFSEVAKRHTRIEYLTLPASALEKTSSKFITTMIVLPIVITIIYFLLGSFGFQLGKFFSPTISLHDDRDYHGTWIYLIVSALSVLSFFAYGSIKYNTGSFVKIIIRYALAFAGFVLISLLFALIIFPEFRAVVFGTEQTMHSNNSGVEMDDFSLVHILRYLFYTLPMMFWVMIYFTIKEKEA